jgi:hypothetical protein
LGVIDVFGYGYGINTNRNGFLMLPKTRREGRWIERVERGIFTTPAAF